jgi:hypothetical protein
MRQSSRVQTLTGGSFSYARVIFSTPRAHRSKTHLGLNIFFYSVQRAILIHPVGRLSVDDRRRVVIHQRAGAALRYRFWTSRERRGVVLDVGRGRVVGHSAYTWAIRTTNHANPAISPQARNRHISQNTTASFSISLSFMFSCFR